eukprot:7389736-Prymnesium_polylepis.2
MIGIGELHDVGGKRGRGGGPGAKEQSGPWCARRGACVVCVCALAARERERGETTRESGERTRREQ